MILKVLEHYSEAIIFGVAGFRALGSCYYTSATGKCKITLNAADFCEERKLLKRLQSVIVEKEYNKIMLKIYCADFDEELYHEIQDICEMQLGSKARDDASELIAQSFDN